MQSLLTYHIDRSIIIVYHNIDMILHLLFPGNSLAYKKSLKGPNELDTFAKLILKLTSVFYAYDGSVTGFSQHYSIFTDGRGVILFKSSIQMWFYLLFPYTL